MIRIKERIEGVEYIRFQNGRSRRCTELYGEPVFLHYVLFKNGWSIKNDYASESPIINDCDFYDFYFNQCHLFSHEILYLFNKWQVDGATLIGYIQIKSLSNIEREHLCKYKI